MNKYRIIVKGILQNGDKYLIVKKWVDDNIMDPFQWSFMDGEVAFGESPDNAVLQLIEEQTGINAQIDRILYTWTFMLGDECNIGIAYLCKTDVADIHLSEDFNEYMWVSSAEVRENMDNAKVIEDLEKYGVLV